jgi:long-chain acyl-CoA synthetase
MTLAWLRETMQQHPARVILATEERVMTAAELLARWTEVANELDALQPGQSVLIDADYSPTAIAVLLAAIDRRCIVVPVARGVRADRHHYLQTTEAAWHITVDSDRLCVEAAAPAAVETHPLLQKLRERNEPGLVLFSSGSTGEPKASLHSMTRLLEKFRVPRKAWRTIAFLLFDHIGGLNTLFYTLANGGCVIAVPDRHPETVCRAIERHRAELLPASPTFLNLLLLSEAWRRFDLSSLKLITYGTEPMPERTLERLHEVFPNADLLQTYGLSELGILRSKSRGPTSLWVKVGGEGVETRVKDGVLQIRTPSSMLGYLNAPSPFDAEGWFDTKDEVEVDGEWLRFKGRVSDVINVGGEKVYPTEVESVLLEIPGVIDATVSGEKHPLTGQIVVASLRLDANAETADIQRRVRRHCSERLARYKVPVKIRIVDENSVSERFKRVR